MATEKTKKQPKHVPFVKAHEWKSVRGRLGYIVDSANYTQHKPVEQFARYLYYTCFPTFWHKPVLNAKAIEKEKQTFLAAFAQPSLWPNGDNSHAAKHFLCLVADMLVVQAQIAQVARLHLKLPPPPTTAFGGR
ncbi:MAG: hypothetical protein WAX89_01950 [Alphaproteobacteria bacterium]